jgi:hypothetical protein
MRIAHLHRAGVWPQVVGNAVVALDVHVKRVLHRTCRVVGGVVQRCEAVPVGLDLGAIGHLKSHARKDLLDAFQRQADRVQAAGLAHAARQRDIQGFGFELAFKFGISQGLPPCIQRGFNGLLGHVDGGAACFLFFHAQGGHALHQLGDAAGLARELRLGVLKLRGRSRRGKCAARAVDNGIQLVHKDSSNEQGLVPFQALALVSDAQATVREDSSPRENQAASLALTCSTMPAKAALSCTAMSASTLRSISMPALRMPLANWL